MQSDDTKNLNLTKDIEELLDLAGRVVGADKAQGNTELKKRITNKPFPQLLGVQATKVEGVMNFAAEWCTADEVVMLRCVSALSSWL